MTSSLERQRGYDSDAEDSFSEYKRSVRGEAFWFLSQHDKRVAPEQIKFICSFVNKSTFAQNVG